MRVKVKATYTTYAEIDVDAHDWDRAVVKVEERAGITPYDFLDTNDVKLTDHELVEIEEDYKRIWAYTDITHQSLTGKRRKQSPLNIRGQKLNQ